MNVVRTGTARFVEGQRTVGRAASARRNSTRSSASPPRAWRAARARRPDDGRLHAVVAALPRVRAGTRAAGAPGGRCGLR